MHRGLTAPGVGIVKTGQIVMDKTGTMDQFQGGGGGIAHSGTIITTGTRHR
jgi:hypothetical protein